MNTTRKIIRAIACASISLAVVLPVNTAAALQLPDPDFVISSSQQTTFLREEMKHAQNLRERQLIHDELVLVYLDQLREPN